MRVCHTISAAFDDPNLIGTAGLVPVMGLAERAGLCDLVTEQVRVPGSAGANAAVKIAPLVAGMVAGADGIDDTIRATDGYATQGSGYGYGYGSRAQRPAGDAVHPGRRTGAGGHPAAQGQRRLRPRRTPADR